MELQLPSNVTKLVVNISLPIQPNESISVFLITNGPKNSPIPARETRPAPNFFEMVNKVCYFSRAETITATVLGEEDQEAALHENERRTFLVLCPKFC